MRVLMPLFGCDAGKSGISSYVQGLIPALSHLPGLELILYASPQDIEWLDLSLFRGTVCTPLCTSFCIWHHALPQFDLIHYPTHRRISPFACRPFVVTVHDVAPGLSAHKYGWLRYLYHNHLLKRLLKNAECCIVPSQFTKNELQKWGGLEQEHSIVIPHGVDRTKWFPEINANSMLPFQGPFILYVSRLEFPDKNHCRLIRAFEMLKARDPLWNGQQLQLVFVGAKWNGAEEIQRCIAHSPVCGCIHYLGFLPQAQIRHLYSVAEVVVMPSLYEGFGLPLLEAAACGAKIACSNGSALREVGEKVHAALFDPLNPEDMAEKIASAPRSILIQEYAWEQVAEATFEVYKQCL